MDNSRRAYNTYEENQRIKESVRIAKREGTNGPIPTTVNINNSKRTYNTYEENQRIKESIRVYNKELERDEAKEALDWLAIIRLPETIRKFLSKRLWILLPIYDLLILFLYYKLTLYINEAFGYFEKISWLFNSPYKLTGNEMIGYLFYLGLFGLPMLYPIVVEIEFIFYLIKDIIRIIKKLIFPKGNNKEPIEEHKTENKEEQIKINFDIQKSSNNIKEEKSLFNEIEENHEEESLFKEIEKDFEEDFEEENFEEDDDD